MTVVTGDKLGAGTDADVYLQMFGELGKSPTMAQTIIYFSALHFYFALGIYIGLSLCRYYYSLCTKYCPFNQALFL